MNLFIYKSRCSEFVVYCENLYVWRTGSQLSVRVWQFLSTLSYLEYPHPTFTELVLKSNLLQIKEKENIYIEEDGVL